MNVRNQAINEFSTWMRQWMGAAAGTYATSLLTAILDNTPRPACPLSEDRAQMVNGLAQLQADDIQTAEAFFLPLEAAKLRNAHQASRRR